MDFKCNIYAFTIAAVLMKCRPVVVFSNWFVINSMGPLPEKIGKTKTNIAVIQNQKSNHLISMGHFSWTMQILIVLNQTVPWDYRSFCSGILSKYNWMYLRHIWVHAMQPILDFLKYIFNCCYLEKAPALLFAAILMKEKRIKKGKIICKLINLSHMTFRVKI